MSTTSAYLTVGGIEVDVVYKEIKNLHIGVYPPWGRVRVAAPERLGDDQVRLAVIGRLSWIKKQQDELRTAERQTIREMVTGESHYVWGDRLRLTVIERPGRPHLTVDGGRLVLQLPEGAGAARRREVLDRWYRQRLREVIPGVLADWEEQVGVSVPSWSIRRMKTKWGSCNRQTGHIRFNVELAKRHPESLEYLAVHEMTHLVERGHGERFTRLMDRTMPDWRARRDRLNQAPLGHERWVRS
jgi:predicted metal-dependent hydrolase